MDFVATPVSGKAMTSEQEAADSVGQNVLSVDRSGVTSLYQRRAQTRGGVSVSFSATAIHIALFVFAFTWLVAHEVDSSWSSGTHAALIIGSTWLILGPYLVVRWQRLHDDLLFDMDKDGELDQEARERLRSDTARFRFISLALIPLPVLLIEGAFVVGGEFVATDVGLHRSSVAFWVAAVILVDALATQVADSSAPMSDADYVRLRSLLELRSHVVQHAIVPPSVEMVKQIPLVVLMPLATTGLGCPR